LVVVAALAAAAAEEVAVVGVQTVQIRIQVTPLLVVVGGVVLGVGVVVEEEAVEMVVVEAESTSGN